MNASRSKPPCRRGILWRTAWQQPDGSYRVVSEQLLIDDKARGIFDLSKWKRKYASFGGRYVSRVARPDRVYSEPKPMSEAELKNALEKKYGYLMAEEKVREADIIFEDLLHRTIIPFVVERICSGQLSEEFKDDALEVAQEAMRRAICDYDPEHPPKMRVGVDSSQLKPASLPTYLNKCAQNAIVDFIRETRSDRLGGWAMKMPITNGGDEGESCSGTVSVEMIPAEAKYDISTLDLCLDCVVVRELIRHIYGERHLTVFDRRLSGDSDLVIYRELGITWRVYRHEYLRPIQILVDNFWIEPHIPYTQWK